MPVVGSKANASAFGLGWSSFAGGAPYFIGAFGSTSYDYGESVDVDTDGNIYILSRTQSISPQQVVVAKIAPDTSIVWKKQITNSLNSQPFSLKVDNSGNVYILGFEYNSSRGYNELFFYKLNSSGSMVFADRIYTVTNVGWQVDNNYLYLDKSTGKSYITATRSDNYTEYITFDTNNSEVDDAYFTHGNSGQFEAICKLANGSMFFCGWASGINSPGYQVAATVVWTPENASTVTLSNHFAKNGAVTRDYLRGCAGNSSSSVFVCGRRASQTGGSASDSILGAFNSSRNLSFTRRLYNSGYSAFSSIALDSSSNIYCVGYNETSSGYWDGLLVKYNSSGTIQWQRKFVSPRQIWLNQVAVDGNDDIVVCGEFNGGAGQTPIGNTDNFIARVPNDGSGTGTYTLGPNNISVTYAASSLTSSNETYGMTGGSVGNNPTGSFIVGSPTYTLANNSNHSLYTAEF